MERHTIEIGKGGAVAITVEGIKGSSCTDATRQIEAALGKTTTSTPTSEMFECVNDYEKATY